MIWHLVFLLKWGLCLWYLRIQGRSISCSFPKNSTKMFKCRTFVWVWSGFIDKNYLYLQIIHVLRFHHSPGGLVGNSGCSSVHLSASVSLSLLPATSRVYFSFLFSSPRLSFSLLGAFSSSHIRDIFLQFTIIIPIILIGDTCTSPPLFISRALLLIGTFSSSHFSFSFLHSHHLMTSQGHLSAIIEPILLPLFSISSHLRGIFRLSCNYFSRPLIRENRNGFGESGEPGRKWFSGLYSILFFTTALLGKNHTSHTKVSLLHKDVRIDVSICDILKCFWCPWNQQ